MDVALWCYINNISSEDLANELSLTEEQAKYVYKDIEAKRRTASYLGSKPVLLS
jgi:NAD+ synthase